MCLLEASDVSQQILYLVEVWFAKECSTIHQAFHMECETYNQFLVCFVSHCIVAVRSFIVLAAVSVGSQRVTERESVVKGVASRRIFSLSVLEQLEHHTSGMCCRVSTVEVVGERVH